MTRRWPPLRCAPFAPAPAPALVFSLAFSLASVDPPAAFSAEEGKGASPAEVDRFLETWAASMAGLETLEIRFRQEKTMRILRRPLLSSGTIRLRLRDGRLRCTSLDPTGKVESEIMTGKGEVRILYPSLRRLEIYDLGNGAKPPVAFPGLGGDVASLKKDYQIRLERGAGGAGAVPNPPAEKGREDRLILTPRDAASPIRELSLLLVDFQLRELRQTQVNGDAMRLSIDEFRKNPAISDRDLEAPIPPGTEVSRPLGKAEGKASGKAGGKAEGGAR